MSSPLPAAPGKLCETCGAPMEIGMVLGLPGSTQGNLGLTPATIGWISGPATGRGPSDQRRADMLADVGITLFSRDPRFPALRCQKCHRVEFTYDNPVYDPATDARLK